VIAAIAIFEARQRLRRISFWAYYLALGAIASLLLASSAGAFSGVVVEFGAGGKVVANAPLALHSMVALLVALCLQLTAAVMGQVVHQDVQARIDPLFFTLPVRPRDYLFGRFWGGILYLSVLYSSIVLGLLVGSALPFLEPTRVGPTAPLAYVLPFFIAVLPSLIFSGALFFSMAALTRQMRAVYTASVVLLAGYLAAQSIQVEPENRLFAALLDPFGLMAVDQLTHYWSIAEKNERLITLSGVLLWNRALWVAAGAGLLAFTLSRFRFAHHATGGAPEPEPRRPTLAVAPMRVTTAAASSGSPWALLPSMTWLAFRETVKNVYFVVIVLSGLLLVLVSAQNMGSMYGTNTHPVTYKVVELVGGMFQLFTILTIILFAGELVWRERDRGMDQLLDAAPIPGALPLLAKLSALGLVQLLMSSVVLVLGLLIQLALGYHRFELDVYAVELFGFMLVRNLLFSVLAVFVHVLVNEKVLGHALMIGLLLFNMFSKQFGLEHNLYRFAGRPEHLYSDINGWGHFLQPILWFQLYWAQLAGLLVVAASLLWVRGKEERWRFRWALARRRLTRPVAAWAGVFALGWAGTGAWIFYNTNVLNRYVTDLSKQREAAEYERLYRVHRDEPAPRVTEVDVAYDVFPEERALSVKATYRLRNTGTATIATVRVTQRPDAELLRLEIGGATATRSDTRLGFHTIPLAVPLPPGEETELRFEARYDSPGFRNGHFDDRLATNGTFVDSTILPYVGYDENRELSADDERRDEGLEPRERMRDLHDPAGRARHYLPGSGDWIRLRSVITTSADQRGLAPGRLVRSSEEGGRRRFEYEVEAPAFPYFSMLSGRWAVREGAWRPGDDAPPGQEVKLEIHHHPDHEYDVDRMLQALRDTLGYLHRSIGPYPHSVLRVVEFPRYKNFAQGFPTLIPFSESVGFIAKVDPSDADDVDYPYYVTAHEVAHQWWGNQLLGAEVQGATLLSETLAQYSALMVMKHAFGPMQMRRFLAFELDRYLHGRSQEKKKELPLVRVENQPYIHYNKGSLAMYALQDRLGEALVNETLRELLARYKWKGPPYPISEELVAALLARAPPEHHGFIRDLFERITLFELRAEQARAARLPDGRWAVTMTVTARKLHADELGRETEAPLDERIPLGVLGDDGKVLALEPRPIRQLRTTFTTTVAEEPRRAGIDPLHQLIDRAPDDNTAAVRL
jgi:ABC-2 type transport system permease protein